MTQASTLIADTRMRSALERRLLMAQGLRENPDAQLLEAELCRRSFPRFCANWGWTYDPRLSRPGKPAFIPFELFSRQLEMSAWFDDCLAAQEDGVLAKSRDIGFTWVFATWSLHKWLFVPGHKTNFASRKEEYVDRIGDPDSFLERVRIQLYRLPPWMLPAGFTPRSHDKHMLLMNPANGNTIRGESGDDIGRGGRASIQLMDEAGHLERPERVEAATSATSNVRIWGGSANGPANLFARKWFSTTTKPERKFRFHFTDDPRKDIVWEEDKRANLDEHVFASEYDIDFSASIEGLFVPGKWVEAAQRLRTLLTIRGIALPRRARGIGGLDVGGGKAKSVFVGRHGALIGRPIWWGNPDTVETAIQGVEQAVIQGCQVLNFDSVGIGQGVESSMKRLGRPGLTIEGINVGVPASEAVWPDKMTSREKFANLKAELWGLARERFKASYELLLHMEKRDGGFAHDPSTCAVFEDNHAETQVLAAQLSLPKRIRNEKGMIACEGKDALAKRGVPSPDYAEAYVLTLRENTTVDEWRRAFGR